MVSDVVLLPLSDLLDIWKQEEIDNLVKLFSNNGLNHDIEDFIKHKAIQYEKFNISRTTLVLKSKH